MTLLLTGKAPAINIPLGLIYMDPFGRQFYFQSQVQAVLGYRPHGRLLAPWLLLVGLCHLVLA